MAILSLTSLYSCMTLLSIFCLMCRSDQGFYQTDGIYIPTKLTDLTNRPTASCYIKTSTTYLATTDDTVRVWLIGDFASSGPHQLGPFTSTLPNKEVSFELDREIGEIQSFFFQKDGYDGWISSTVTCEMKGKKYSADNNPPQWLDNFDADLASVNAGNGHEPGQQGNYDAKSTLILNVNEKVQLYTDQGDIMT